MLDLVEGDLPAHTELLNGTCPFLNVGVVSEERPASHAVFLKVFKLLVF